MEQTIAPDQLARLAGRELGVSDWFTIDQQRIDAFADATEDHQFVHVDPQRARETPFGTTIAHGLLTLSLIVRLCLPFVPRLEGTRMVLNYGFDKVRFPAPVRVDSRIRATVSFAGAEQRRPGQWLIRLDVSIEIENEPKPALVAEWLSLHLIG